MISLKAPAKINIGLRILNKRDDGYHGIETTFATINLSDLLTMEPSGPDVVLEANAPDIRTEDNLCFRAAELFRRRYGITDGVRIRLVKNIPVGAGLGGGSSDAAATLKGMARLFSMNIEDHELMALAAELGADVPFFIKGGAAYARGRGEQLNFFKLPRMELVLYYPGYPISTKWAYQEYDRTMLTPGVEVDSIVRDKKKKVRQGFALENDFEKVVFKHHPDLLDVKMNLLSTGVFFVSLSGSGSCLFTLVDESTRPKVIKYLEGIGAQYFEVNTI